MTGLIWWWFYSFLYIFICWPAPLASRVLSASMTWSHQRKHLYFFFFFLPAIAGFPCTAYAKTQRFGSSVNTIFLTQGFYKPSGTQDLIFTFINQGNDLYSTTDGSALLPASFQPPPHPQKVSAEN